MVTPAESLHAQRIAHLHRNAPGVLAELNKVLAGHEVNIGGQVLATRGHLGYVVTDTDSALTADVLDSLRRIDDTIRLRVID
jgi:D-3-phosphoglycerate dehydrogenase